MRALTPVARRCRDRGQRRHRPATDAGVGLGDVVPARSRGDARAHRASPSAAGATATSPPPWGFPRSTVSAPWAAVPTPTTSTSSSTRCRSEWRSSKGSCGGSSEVSLTVRGDLAAAHRSAWEHIASAGSWWTGAQRVELARTALMAIADADPLPPWVAMSSTDRFASGLAPAAAHDIAYRLACHAGTITHEVYRAVVAEIDELPYVELCAIVSTVAAVAHFCRNIGVALPDLSGARRRASHRCPSGTGRAGRAQLGAGGGAGRPGGGRGSGLHGGARRDGQHVAHGRRAVHARAGDGRPGAGRAALAASRERRWSWSRRGSRSCVSASIE